ncbi:hypothetical protein RA210_U20460 [Rubrivivax sp. A210]|nr:hypothetical protein RA210_U20460 [Rubrivivax sp. A210]
MRPIRQGRGRGGGATRGRNAHQKDKRDLTSLSDPFVVYLVGPGRLELPTNGLRVRCSTN